MSIIFATGSSGPGPPTVNNTGPGPRQALGLPQQPKGAGVPPQPQQPLTPYQQQGNTGLPGPNLMGIPLLPKPLLPYDPTTALGY